MSDEFMELYGEWGSHADGTPKALTVEPYMGQNASGKVYGPAESHPGLPQFGQQRLVRNSQGNEATSTAAVYAPLDLAGHFPLNSRVTLADGRQAAVLSHATPDAFGLFGFMVVNVE